jgi:hypothetical protein
MSTLSVVNLQNLTSVRGPSSATLPIFQDSNGTEYGRLCRAWVAFNGSTLAIIGSFNIQSVQRNATGLYTVTLLNPLPNGNYSLISNSINTGIFNFAFGGTVVPSSFPISNSFILTYMPAPGQNYGGQTTDPSYISAIIFG